VVHVKKSGCQLSSVELEIRDLKSILEMIHDGEGVIDLVKMDCEGCEYSLLQLDEEHIKLSKQYIMEIHGCETPLIDKMLQVGYNSKLILKLNELGKIYLPPFDFSFQFQFGDILFNSSKPFIKFFLNILPRIFTIVKVFYVECADKIVEAFLQILSLLSRGSMVPVQT
jgi:hypothetical protein